ncbi:hypothetical protein [Flammeovirga sp. OC4]|uniref:hypothetical protein n=1 Tax=Flammeovirga sp. OC4 TaxID=1382345 RepID=UPI0005C774C4|nr:hypothetical protein [Flammeovirga sp. OC4]
MKHIKHLTTEDKVKKSIQHHAVHLRRITNTHVDLLKVEDKAVTILVDISSSNLEEAEAIKRGENIFKNHLSEEYTVHVEIKKEKEKASFEEIHLGIIPSKGIVGTTISSTKAPYFTCELFRNHNEGAQPVHINNQHYHINFIDYDASLSIHEMNDKLNEAASFCKTWFVEFGYLLEKK